MKHLVLIAAAALSAALTLGQQPVHPALMQVTRDGDMLVIRVPLHQPKLSSTGKTMTVATGREIVDIDGQSVTVQVNAYIPQ